MPVTVACPSCGSRLNAPDQFVGKKVKCPKCGDPVVVADPAADAGFEVVDDSTPPKPKPKSRPPVVIDEDDRPRKRKPARDDDDDYDDDRPRPKKKAAKKKSILPLIIGFGVAVVLAGGAVTAWQLWPQAGKAPAGPVAGPPASAPVAGPGKAADHAWARLDAPDGSFVAYFPGGPPKAGDLAALIRAQGGDPAAAVNMEKSLATLGVKLQVWTRQENDRIYMIHSMAFPPAAAQEMTGPNGLNNVVAGMKSSLTQGGNALESESEATVGGKPGKQIITRNPTTGKAAVTTISLSGPKVYILAVFGDATLKAGDATAKQFFDKFELK